MDQQKSPTVTEVYVSATQGITKLSTSLSLLCDTCGRLGGENAQLREENDSLKKRIAELEKPEKK